MGGLGHSTFGFSVAEKDRRVLTTLRPSTRRLHSHPLTTPIPTLGTEGLSSLPPVHPGKTTPPRPTSRRGRTPWGKVVNDSGLGKSVVDPLRQCRPLARGVTFNRRTNSQTGFSTSKGSLKGLGLGGVFYSCTSEL